MLKTKLPTIIKQDPWLAPYTDAIVARMNYAKQREKQLTQQGKMSLSDFAHGYAYYGLHKVKSGWVFREWAPEARSIHLIGDFNGWQKSDQYELKPIGQGNWELHLDADQLHHESLYKMHIEWGGGSGERLPAYATRVVQDEQTHIFSAQVWSPKKKFKFKHNEFKPNLKPLLIYECHIGMSLEDERVATYVEFRDLVLPRIAALGYNAIQIMALQEHPYYGSFGYHVSNFFAASSRFGTPEELMSLVDAAHGLGIAVIMDIVHSHAVKNENEGLACMDGSNDMYFHSDHRRNHPAWDSLCFNYGKDQVLHFLLSNCRYWMEEYQIDGFRFDGVTSMLYYSHGLNESFGGYEDYYNGNQDGDAICYLTLANKLIHQLKPGAVTIAEEMSGMPGLALSIAKGGMGFDYRMAMGIPDYWIKLLKEKKDEQWNVTDMLWVLTDRRADEKTISYVESHDQAMVGDKTVIFRLIDEKMYWHMMRWDDDLTVARGIALHKMIRLFTLSTINGGYLNFMGNEFGHPEWIDFPRQGNGWSYKYARRQWSLLDRKDLKYQFLNAFDEQMIQLFRKAKTLSSTPVNKIWDHEGDQVTAFQRGKYLFVFNFNPEKSFSDYGFLVKEGKYKVVLNSDDPLFGGQGRVDMGVTHFTNHDDLYHDQEKGWLKLYLPTRSALVLIANK